MAAVDLRSLITKLDDPCRKALEAAAGLTLSRTHYNVEIEHYLLKLLDIQGGDFEACLKHYGVDEGVLAADLNRVLDRLKTGNSRPPALAPQIVSLIKEAWLIGSLGENAGKVRSGHLLAALLSDEYKSFPTLYRSLVTERNRRWVPQIEKLLKDKENYFVVVGALHLVGDGGLLELMKRDGFKAEQLN